MTSYAYHRLNRTNISDGFSKAGVSLKTRANPRGFHREQELYKKYAAAGTYAFFNNNPADDWHLRERALKVANEYIARIGEQLDDELAGVLERPLRFLRRVFENITTANDQNDEVIKLLSSELTADGETGVRNRRSLAASVFAEYVPTAPIFSKIIAHVVNFYLDESRKALREQILEHGATAALIPYIYEALRTSCWSPSVLCVLIFSCRP